MYGIIYSALNIRNGKRYIGQTIHSLDSRRRGHYRYKKNNHFFYALQKNRGLFLWTILDTASDKQELDNKEAFWIQFYNTTNREYGYNKQQGGSGRGIIHNDTRVLLSLAGRNRTLEQRKRAAQIQSGKKYSEKSKKKMSEKKKQSYQVTSPLGDTYTITGLTEFCAAQGLNRHSMGSVWRGKQDHHQGWKIRKLHKI
jgi:hypothetical protein